jgi:PEP-CTERM motif-containing protein
MSFSKLSLLAVAATLTFSGISAHADSLTLGNFSTGVVSSNSNAGVMTVKIGVGSNTTTITGSGGNFAGSTGVINGQAVSFSELFCVDLFDSISLGGTYNATDNTVGKIFNQSINNAAEIAWLITDLAPEATTAEENEAVQVAIWEEEYGSSFKLISADAGVALDAATDFNEANAVSPKNLPPVDSVEWISPTTGSGRDTNDAQGMVGLVNDPTPAVPEPATLSLFGTGILGLAGLVRRGRTV